MIQIRGLCKQFGQAEVLRGVDLDIHRGETHVVLGRSGEGKSVLLKLISGLLRPDRGEIAIDGETLDYDRPESLAQARAKIQMLFQGGALFDSLDVAHNIAFHAAEHQRIRYSRAAEFAEKYLQMVDLGDSGTKMPSDLSGGQRKRVSLARALAASPEIMLYDEPTTGLDPLTSEVINNLIRETQKHFEVTSIVVTHDMRSARRIGDRCSFLMDGRIVETTTPDRLIESDCPAIREFAS